MRAAPAALGGLLAVILAATGVEAVPTATPPGRDAVALPVLTADDLPSGAPDRWPGARPPEVTPKSGKWGDVDLGVRVERRVAAREGASTTLRVRVAGRSEQAARDAVLAHGGRVLSTLGRWALADVPAGHVAALQTAPGVENVQSVDGEEPPPAPSSAALTGAKGGEPVAKTGIGTLHAAGLVGQGVKVGIIDYFDAGLWNAAANAGEVPAPAAAGCVSRNKLCDVWTYNPDPGARAHGIKVAETIHDMAPGATLYLATAGDSYDTRTIIDWFAANGVRIISRSLGASFDGPGNGTGPWAEAVAYAESKGIAWFNSAGNSAGRGKVGGYYRFGWNDPDGDGWMNFSATSQPAAVTCESLEGMRWSDWGTNRTDYDLYVVDPTTGTVVYQSRDDQRAASPYAPIEAASGYWTCNPDVDWYQLWVQLYNPGSGTAGDVLELAANGYLSPSSNASSAGGSVVDSRSASMAAVGAVDPWNGVTIASYSSEGPTNDGRMKPELSAASNFSSFTGGSFNGTSAATPVVAGAGAVLLSANPTWTPAQLVAALKATVVDRGAPGPDNVFGTGELAFVAPQAQPQPQPAIVAPGGIAWVKVKAVKHRRVKFRWAAPTATGGELTGYFAVVTKKGKSKPVLKRSTGPGTRSFTVRLSKLGRGRFKVRVFAINTAGAGPGRATRFRVR